MRRASVFEYGCIDVEEGVLGGTRVASLSPAYGVS